MGERRGRGLPRTVTAATLGRGRTWKPFLEPSGSTGGAPSGTALKQAEGTWTQTKSGSELQITEGGPGRITERHPPVADEGPEGGPSSL